MNDTLKLIETRTINDALVNGYYGKKEAWFTRDEIGSVLGYADPRQSIANIHNRHKERFSDKSVQINLICTDGKSYDTTVYNFKGVMEICRWSKQPKADMVMEALYDMAESVARTGFYSVLPDQELIDLLVKRQSENPTFLREAAVDLKSRKLWNSLPKTHSLENCGNRELNSLSVSTRVNSMLSVTATSPFSARKSRNTRNGTPLLRLAR